MAIVGFNFIKINAEKSSAPITGKVEINHGTQIKDVIKTNLNLSGSKTEVLKIQFGLEVKYSSGLGNIEIVGDVVYSDTKEIIEEAAKGWDADKKLNSMISAEVLKFVYSKAIVKTLELSDSLGLPSPIPLPKVNFGNK